ncbi:hypothetical protein F5Y13DRAFT_124889 [Hypoxylon sp. FL1857]|nr:hypothetical protein F5Y13DRAFT_124889 [Hypoxylon sp. FL1857]
MKRDGLQRFLLFSILFTGAAGILSCDMASTMTTKSPLEVFVPICPYVFRSKGPPQELIFPPTGEPIDVSYRVWHAVVLLSQFLGRARREVEDLPAFRKQLANYTRPQTCQVGTCVPIFVILHQFFANCQSFSPKYSLAQLFYVLLPSPTLRSSRCCNLGRRLLCPRIDSEKNARTHRKEKSDFFGRQSFASVVDAMARSMGMTEKEKKIK